MPRFWLGGRRLKLAALVLLSPVALTGLLLSPDALSLLRFRDAVDYSLVAAYFLLLALLIGLLVRTGMRLGVGT